MNTTLNKIRSHGPCKDGWKKLLTYLGKTKADDEPLSIETILDSNGVDDAVWCLRTVDGYDREIRLFAVWCAKQVEHLMTDLRSIAALNVAEAYANGQATDKELSAARAKAARAASAAASAAAWAAENAAAWAAARTAASAAANDAASAAANDAASAAAWAAARDAARENQADKLREICAAIRARGEA
jgi:hypothetical protein